MVEITTQILGNLVISQFEILVRERGLEPLHLAALDPKSSASANFATPAINTSNSTAYAFY